MEHHGPAVVLPSSAGHHPTLDGAKRAQLLRVGEDGEGLDLRLLEGAAVQLQGCNARQPHITTSRGRSTPASRGRYISRKILEANADTRRRRAACPTDGERGGHDIKERRGNEERDTTRAEYEQETQTNPIVSIQVMFRVRVNYLTYLE